MIKIPLGNRCVGFDVALLLFTRLLGLVPPSAMLSDVLLGVPIRRALPGQTYYLLSAWPDRTGMSRELKQGRCSVVGHRVETHAGTREYITISKPHFLHALRRII